MQGSEIRRDWGGWGLDAENKSFGLNAGCARLNCQGNSAGFGRGLIEQRGCQGHSRTGKARNFEVIWNDHGHG